MDRPDYNKLEKNQAKKDGATLVPNSGRGPNRKGDAILGNICLDYKFCSGKSFSLNVEKWEKHYKDAWRENREGAQVAVFGNRRIAMVDWDWLQRTLEDYEYIKFRMDGLEK